MGQGGLVVMEVMMEETRKSIVETSLYPSDRWHSLDADASHLRIPPGVWPSHIELDGIMFEFGLHLYTDDGEIDSTLYFRRDRGHTINVKNQ